MKCPICDLDLSPLDLVSRAEHVDLCIENGPSVLDIGQSGTLVIKKNVPVAKQRKICPICDKTFQNLSSHFKTCALKNDLPPNLMLDYWDKIHSGLKNPKKFPRDLLDNFVARCVKEGRVGEQVDFARALSISMAESEGLVGHDPIENKSLPETAAQNELSSDAASATGGHVSSNNSISDPLQTIFQATTSASNLTKPKKIKPTKTFRLQIVDEETKRTNIILRIDRELAATRTRRYEELVKYSKVTDVLQDDECMILPDLVTVTQQIINTDTESEKLFHRARMKKCDGSKSCLEATCLDHDFLLLLNDFKLYSGASL